MQDKFVVAYEYRKQNPNEKKYAVYDFELFVVIHALKMWRHYLLAKRLTLMIDHIKLKCIFIKIYLNVRQSRWIDFSVNLNLILNILRVKRINYKMLYVEEQIHLWKFLLEASL